ncbi:MAG: tRNA 2-thiocytidine(32) synthetase TtcA [Proteobacteria bacterium]|nr:tRNA 2-thiocytidine(32) synthetase TtcA [Pseudomonadota bacterium]
MNSYTVHQIEHSIIRKAGKAIGDFNLIEHGDKIMVCLSGGKDSWTLLHVLKKLQCKAPVHFELFPVTIDPGFPDFNGQEISSYMTTHYNDLPFLLYESHIYQIIKDKKTPGTSFCSFCARLRRGVLYTLAKKLGVSKIAIGHNADDFIETLLLNQFFNGQIKAMSPCLHADDGINIVIRPLCYVEESLIAAFIARVKFPIVDVRCAGRQEKDMKRQKVKKLLTELDAQHPGLKSSLLHSLSNIDVRHLMDKRFQQF